MIGFDEELELLERPWVIATAIPPVRPQIPFPGLDYQSVLDALGKRLAENQLFAPRAGSSISDPTMALADAWAVVAEILGFYQWRIVNESYVGTACESGSVVELARMVGYVPDQGFAATCHVFYTIDESVLREVRIAAGSKVRAIPQPGEEPQTFETRKDLIARSRWNAMRPATTRNAEVDLTSRRIYLAETANGLKPNDLLVVVDRRTRPEGREMYFLVRAVEFDRQANQTIAEVALRYPPVPDHQRDDPKRPASVASAAVATDAAKRNKDPRTTSAYYQSQMQDQAWIEDNVLSALKRPAADAAEGRSSVEVIGFRKRAMVFGHNAPRRLQNPRRREDGDPWKLDLADFVPDVIDLEGHHPGVLPESKLCIEIPNRSVHSGDMEIFVVKAAELTSRTAYGMTGSITRVTLDRPWKTALWEEAYAEVVQQVAVHVDDVSMRLGMMPIKALGATPDKAKPPAGREESASGQSEDAPTVGEDRMIELDGIYLGLEPGHRVILDGEPPASVKRAKTQEPELLTILRVYQPPYPEEPAPGTKPDGKAPEGVAAKGDAKKVEGGANTADQERPRRTIVTFVKSLKYQYNPETVKIYGNVVEASHGETYEEVLGSGDGTREHQSFALTRKPLTQLRIKAFPGAKPEISVKVGGEEWGQVATLANARAEQRAFALWIDDTATVRVVFGSGRVGARLPTGRENVSARYRVGLGRAGNIGGGRLTLAVDHPLGVQGVSNTRAAGGSDPEPLSRVRANAPLSTLALDRLVSRGDYLSFARTYPGIAKAKVFHKSTPAGDVVVVSILNNATASLGADDPLCKALRTAMVNRGDGSPTLFVTPGLLCPLYIDAKVKIRPDESWDDASDVIRAALNEAFGFERREFGQAAHESEVLAVIHSVPTVEFATLQEFHRYDPEAKKPWPKFSPSIEASEGGFGKSGEVIKAELLLVQPHMPSTVVLKPDLS